MNAVGLARCPTGIAGLDEILEGGLPRGRSTLVCGEAGSGKTLMALEFIVRGARRHGEHGVFVSFEESESELVDDVRSLGFELENLVAEQRVCIEYVSVDPEAVLTGSCDLEALLARVGAAIDAVGAKRVAVDGMEALLRNLPAESMRSELHRLFRWFKDRGLTVLTTGERGVTTLSRSGFEEYVSDCVIVLDHRICNQVATRRLRILKYRGSQHGTNEYPTLITEHGLSVLPISSVGLTYAASTERVTTGIERLDSMLGGGGYYQGSSILVSGEAGSGKSSIAAAFADSVCRSGGRCLYWSSEESPLQIVRNMASIGFDFARHIADGRLSIRAVRPTAYGLEGHLFALHKLVEEERPDALVVDPVTNFEAVGDPTEIRSMLTRVIDFLKSLRITTVFTSLTTAPDELSSVGISSLMDTWILLRMVESAQERNRLIFVLKSRGMAHSNQMREFILSRDGIELLDVYVGLGAVHTGSARLVQEMRDRAEAEVRQRSASIRQRRIERKRRRLKRLLEALTTRLEDMDEEQELANFQEAFRLQTATSDAHLIARARKAD